MKHEVKVVDFEFRDIPGPSYVSEKLADLLDEGYSIIGQSESSRFLTYTLVRIVPIPQNMEVSNTDHQTRHH